MRRRQKIWPKISLTITLWVTFFYILFYVSPEKVYVLNIASSALSLPSAKIAFFTTLLLSLTLTLGLIFKSLKNGLILSLFLTTFLFLKMLQVVNWLTLLLLIVLTAIMILA